MSNPAAPSRPKARSQRRFSLRTLFIISAAIAVPFLLLANLRNFARPDDSLASPLYLLVGVAGVLVSAAIGNALAGKPGTLITAVAAGLIWILLVALLSQFSDMLTRQLPVHVVVVVVTIAALAVVVQRHRETTDDTTHEHLARLIQVKKELHDASAVERAAQSESAASYGDTHRS